MSCSIMASMMSRCLGLFLRIYDELASVGYVLLRLAPRRFPPPLCCPKAHGRVAAEAGCGLAEQDARAGPLNRAPVANGRAVRCAGNGVGGVLGAGRQWVHHPPHGVNIISGPGLTHKKHCCAEACACSVSEGELLK